MNLTQSARSIHLPIGFTRPSTKSLIALWVHRHASRKALVRLDALGYADIGLTPDQVRHEAAKPFWKA